MGAPIGERPRSAVPMMFCSCGLGLQRVEDAWWRAQRRQHRAGVYTAAIRPLVLGRRSLVMSERRIREAGRAAATALLNHSMIRPGDEASGPAIGRVGGSKLCPAVLVSERTRDSGLHQVAMTPVFVGPRHATRPGLLEQP